MTTYNEPARALEFLLSEASGTRSRESVTLAASQGDLPAGTVLGKITIGAKTAVGAAGTPAPAAATITAAPTAGASAKVGVHTFTCVIGGAGTASKWQHEDPEGEFVGTATGDTEYSGGGISGLTITDAGTDPVAGEQFTVTVTMAAASGYYAIYDNTATNGTEVAAGVLAYPADNSASTQSITIIARDAEVKEDYLDWDDNDSTGITDGTADLAAVGIIVRAA